MEKKMLRIKASYKPLTDKVCIYGETYAIKEELKKLGFRWDPADECWAKEIPPREVGRAVKELEERLGVKVSYQPLEEAIKSIEYASGVLEWIARRLESEEFNSVLKNVRNAYEFLKEKGSDIELALFAKGGGSLIH